MKISIKADGTFEFDGNDMGGVDPAKIADIVNIMKGAALPTPTPTPKSTIGKGKVKGVKAVGYFDMHSQEVIDDVNLPLKTGDYQYLTASDLIFTSPYSGRCDLNEKCLTAQIHKSVVEFFLANENTPSEGKFIAAKIHKKSPHLKESTIKNMILEMPKMGILSTDNNRPRKFFLSSKFINQ